MDRVSGSYDYFEHQADMGILGCGATLAEAFAQGARAMFDLMVELDQVQPLQRVAIECQGNDQAELFVEWLNRLLAEADIRRMTFSQFQVNRLTESHLQGLAWGEPLDVDRHGPKTEVKAATYAMLFVGKEREQYVARCVVDL